MRRLALTLVALSAFGCASSPPPPVVTARAPSVAAPAVTETPNEISATEVLAAEKILADAKTGPDLKSRAHVAPVSFVFSSLPVADLPEPIPANIAPASLPKGSAPVDVVIEPEPSEGRGAKADPAAREVKLVGHALGRVRVGFGEAAITRGVGSVGVRCAKNDARLLPARWESLDPEGADGARYTVTNGWFDVASCSITVVGRASVVMKSIASRMLFAYRQTCAACTSGESLVVVGPALDGLETTAIGGDPTASVSAAITRVVLPIRRGGSASLLAHVLPATATSWFASVGNPPDDVTTNAAIAGVDVLQTVEDDEPHGVAYVSWPTEPTAFDTSANARAPSKSFSGRF